MSAEPTILLPLDGCPLSATAAPYAAWFARASGAQVALVHARPVTAVSAFHPEAGLIEAAQNRQRGRATSHQLRLVAEDLTRRGVTVNMSTGRGAPAVVILEVARSRCAGLIVMASRREGGLTRLLYGSVADAVLRRSTVPVVLVTARCGVAPPHSGPLRVLVALDGSSLAEQALHHLAHWTGDVSLELVLLRTVDASDPAEENSAGSYLAQLQLDPASVTTGVVNLVEHGDTAEVILRVADEQNVDMIAMGTHGRGGLERLLLGSVTSAVLARTHLPMLLCPAGSLQRIKPNAVASARHRLGPLTA